MADHDASNLPESSPSTLPSTQYQPSSQSTSQSKPQPSITNSNTDTMPTTDGPRSTIYPDPLIIPPSAPHTQTWIILHGRGDAAKSFATGFMGLLNMLLPPNDQKLTDRLPHVKFVLPTASYRRARVFNRATITQWFDIYSWNSTERTDWQVTGLRETSAWISELVRREAEIVGGENVVVGGLSQGCASVLAWNLVRGVEEVPVKCVFGMSGWLPFRHVLEGCVPDGQGKAGEVEGEDDDVFERQAETQDQNAYISAMKALLQELDMDGTPSTLGRTTPILLAHGNQDRKVACARGKEAAECLRGLGCDVQWKEYEELEHWFNGRELADVVSFVEGLGQMGESTIKDGEGEGVADKAVE